MRSRLLLFMALAGFVPALMGVQACEPVDTDGDGYTDDADCGPLDPEVHDGAAEVCDLKDNDCDAEVDEGFTPEEWYADADADAYHGGEPVIGCMPPDDGLMYSLVFSDCDDHDPSVYPGAPENCNDQDDDCDGAVDESSVKRDWYVDADGDQWGVPPKQFSACIPTNGRPGFAYRTEDCDDTDPDVYPGSTSPGDDCGIAGQRRALTDQDMDGDGYTTTMGDCNDRDPLVNPGATEICDDGIDQDCSGGSDVSVTYYADADRDGYGNPDPAKMVKSCTGKPAATTTVLWDCDDQDSKSHPGAADTTCDGVDQDCSGHDGPASCTVPASSLRQ